MNDVIISTVGTIGNSAVVTADMLPANCDRDVGIIRLSDKMAPYALSTFLLSRYGRAQTRREITGNVQPHLFLSKISGLLIPEIPERIQQRLVSVVREAHSLRLDSLDRLKRAGEVLSSTLGLDAWKPPSNLSCIRRFSDVRDRERLDAEHYREEFYAAIRRLKKAGAIEFVPMGDLLMALTNGHTPLHHDLEIGDVPFLCAEHVSNFEVHYDSEKRILLQQHRTELGRTALQNGDVLLTIKGRVGNAALVEGLPCPANINQDVALLRLNNRFPTWYVLAFINSIFGQLLVNQLSTGGINPFLGLSNVRKLQIPEFDATLMKQIANDTKTLITDARKTREKAQRYLDSATRAVEILIEQNDAEAMKYLSKEAR